MKDEKLNLRALTRKYLGWCPGTSSAAAFQDNRLIRVKPLIENRAVICLIIWGLIAAFGVYCWTIELHNAQILNEYMKRNPFSLPRDVNLVWAPWSIAVLLVSVIPFLGAIYYHAVSGGLERDWSKVRPHLIRVYDAPRLDRERGIERARDKLRLLEEST